MKNLLMLYCCLASMISYADDTYTPPTQPSVDEAKIIEKNLQDKQLSIKAHWQARLVLAKQNDLKLAQPGMPLKRPYYGDGNQHH